MTGRIAPGKTGEVTIQINGGTEAFHAFAYDTDETFEIGTLVTVMEFTAPRTVHVIHRGF